MLSTTLSWIFSALSYDENKICEYILKYFPKFKCHFKAFNDGSVFCGVVIDEKNGRLWSVKRGTDGFNKGGEIKSWIRDLNLITGSDGVHNGFQSIGNMGFDYFKNYFYNVDEIFVCGHSQGAGVAPYESCLVVENIPNIRHCHFDIWAAPPTGDERFFNRIKSHNINGILSGDRYISKKDPINTKLFRLDWIPLLDGVDVGEECYLPEIIGYNLGPGNYVNHSPKVYNAQMILFYLNIKYTHFEDYEILGKIHEKIIV